MNSKKRKLHCICEYKGKGTKKSPINLIDSPPKKSPINLIDSPPKKEPETSIVDLEQLPLGAGGEVYYIPKWLKPKLARELYKELTTGILAAKNREPAIINVGRVRKTPRNIVNFGKPGAQYKYSKRTFTVQEEHNINNFPILSKVRGKIQSLAKKKKWINSDQEFDFILANYYEHGNHSISKHSDATADLASPTIISLSLGATRKFIYSNRNYVTTHQWDTKANVAERKEKNFEGCNLKPGQLANVEVPLSNGDLIVMTGDTQKCWVHEIPKQRKIKNLRINLTFRVSKKYNKK